MSGLQGYNFHVVGGDPAIDKIMEEEGMYSSGLKQADFVIFSGGTDISPSLYNDFVVRPETQKADYDRDKYETKVFNHMRPRAKLLIGICRGAQLLCALNGGKLWQHVTGHHGTHIAVYENEKGRSKAVSVTSDHHQMMIPPKGAEMWCMASKSTHKYNSYTGSDEAARMIKGHMADPEVVFIRNTRSLCFQPHPEWVGTACRKLFFQCINRALKATK